MRLLYNASQNAANPMTAGTVSCFAPFTKPSMIFTISSAPCQPQVRMSNDVVDRARNYLGIYILYSARRMWPEPRGAAAAAATTCPA
eukprot:COSAG06_NODE_1013_length_11079_cov_7.729053_8_plen_87_part_00